MLTVPVSPTTTVMDAACSEAPDASEPPVVGSVPGTVVVVVVMIGPVVQHVVMVVVGGANVNVTGPEVTLVRAFPEPSVASVLLALLLNVPGASGATQRTETPVTFSPDAVLTEIATDERDLRVPERIVIGMYSELSVDPFTDFAYVYSVAVDDANAVTGATTLVDCD